MDKHPGQLPLELWRYDGAGNRFLILDYRHEVIDPFSEAAYSAIAQEVCVPTDDDGSYDGLLVLTSPDPDVEADLEYRIWNADGTQAEMCGNGARCVVLHCARMAVDQGRSVPEAREALRMVTIAGVVHGWLNRIDLAAGTGDVRIDLGEVTLSWAALGAQTLPNDANDWSEGMSLEPVRLNVAGAPNPWYGASLGNPHILTIVADVDAVKLEQIGPALSTDGHFRAGTNVHVMQIHNPRRVRVRHWERGAGPTAACGTGAAACAAVAIELGHCESPVTVDVPGGRLRIEYEPEEHAFLSGPALAHGVALRRVHAAAIASHALS